ncbi:peptide deformylase [Gordonia sp. HY285]|uniref:peptide deformylase n=1 Tax=Gordonia liuliyuniae TaxID=2911517 RepID=UPI001F321339|nr:peptide deformylase [Gordonia liuliyuniae]MCF8611709.1 peptide deformylase [Gordonia liuliyuniae]
MARPDVATCRGYDQYGEPVTLTGGGTFGRCLQHETDHINGTVFGDRLSARSRKQLYRRFDAVPRSIPQPGP